ncbi:unnamed protein product [Durusdinium trenchii]|uniref:Ankyrin repeat domain-containing protein n=1 Tax=Durusdinium trenchii TaxID=1381693 RepID=A0ABP0LLI9_9DINO
MRTSRRNIVQEGTQLSFQRILKNAVSNGQCGTALHYAAERGHVAAVKALLAAGAAVNAVMNSGDTPLHKAASGDHLEVARALVAHGASPDVKDLNGFTPAALAPRKTAVAEFLEAEAKK